MASSAVATRLTEGHRLAQTRLGAQTVAAMRTIWPLLDPEDLDRTAPRWMSAARRIVAVERTNSARLAARYLQTFKVLEVGGTAPIVLPPALPVEQVTTSLFVTGPVQIKRAVGSGVLLTRAVATAEATSAASAMRLSLNGGRDTIRRSIDADDQALGYARAASGNACAFCAMLASRGPVYGEESGDFAAHDHCTCGVEPVYREDAGWPPNSERYRDVWQEAKAADGDTLSNFRAALTGA